MHNMLKIAIALLVTATLQAREATLEQKISSLYVSFFNRAPDYAGLSYWKHRGEQSLQEGADTLVTLKELSAGFAQHPTFTSTYASMSDEDFVKAIYRNSLGREGDAGGVSYWATLLNNGKSRSDMVAEFMNMSLTLDLTPENFPTLSPEELAAAQERQDLIANKVEVAIYFTKELGTKTNVVDTQNPENDPAYLASKRVISDVGIDRASVISATDKIEQTLISNVPINIINNNWKNIDTYINKITSLQKSLIERYYKYLLGKPADNDGKAHWLQILQTTSAANVANIFFNLSGLLKKLNDKAFIETLYLGLFNKQADASGISNWLAELHNGLSREGLLNIFYNTMAFKTLADTADVTAIRDKDQLSIALVANAGVNQIAETGTVITLSSLGSKSNYGYIKTYEWKEGDTILSNAFRFQKADFTIGVHNISLKITDNFGQTSIGHVVITITNKQTKRYNIMSDILNETLHITFTDNISFTKKITDNSQLFWCRSSNIQYAVGYEFECLYISNVWASKGKLFGMNIDDYGNITGQYYDVQGTTMVFVGSYDGGVNGYVQKTPHYYPLANAGADQFTQPLSTVYLNGSKSSHQNGNILTYLWKITKKPVGSSANLSNTTEVSPYIKVNKEGIYVISLVVNDGYVNSEADTIIINVVDNNPPIADAGSDSVGTLYTKMYLDGSNSQDQDGDEFTYSWSFVSKPNGSVASLVNPTSKNPIFIPDKEGTYTVALTTKDKYFNSNESTVTIIISKNYFKIDGKDIVPTYDEKIPVPPAVPIAY